MTIYDLLDFGTRELMEFDSARLDTELILAHIIERDITYLIAHGEVEVGYWQARKFKKLIARRKKGEPVAYILGHKEFFGLDFEVNKHVLVPRPDTEILVEAVGDYITDKDLLLDVGTGSGCIPISLIHQIHKLEAVAVDISSKALKVAQINAHRHHVFSRMIFLQSNLLEKVDRQLFEGWEVIVTANLPYVPKNYQTNIETKFEPQIALYSEDDGLDLYKKLMSQLSEIRPKAIFFECFDFQAAIIAEQMKDYKLKFVKNALGPAVVGMLERNS